MKFNIIIYLKWHNTLVIRLEYQNDTNNRDNQYIKTPKYRMYRIIYLITRRKISNIDTTALII